MRWLMTLVVLIAAFFAFRFYWTSEQRQIQSELDLLAETGRPSTQLFEYRFICFDDQFGTRNDFQAAAGLQNLNQCGIRNSCCFAATDSDIPALIGLVRGQEIECIKVVRVQIVVEPSRVACFEPSRFKVSREVFNTDRDPRDGAPRTVGANYYKISQQLP